MKVIVSGCRHFEDDKYRQVVYSELDRIHTFDTITEIVSGKCPTGPDTFGEDWAADNDIHVEPFEAKWIVDGKYHASAGPVRNRKMAEYGDMLIALWDKKSRGTHSMIKEARRKNLAIMVYTFPGE